MYYYETTDNDEFFQVFLTFPRETTGEISFEARYMYGDHGGYIWEKLQIQ